MDEKIQKIIAEYSKMIYRIAFKHLRVKTDADDVVQEVLIKYMLNKKSFKDKNHERNWIIRVSLNCSHNFRISNFRTKTVPIEDVVDLEHEYQYELLNELDLLKDKYKTVIQLFYLEGLSIKDISEILKISESNVKTRLKRAREMIENIIGCGDFIDV